MSNGPPKRAEAKGLLEFAVSIAGLLTLAVALIYAAGAGIYIIELNENSLPGDMGVVTALPREFLVGTGLLYVASPLILVSVVLFVVAPAVENGVSGSDWIRLGILGTAIVAGLVFAVDPSSLAQALIVVAIAAVTVALLFAFLYLGTQETDGVRGGLLVLLALLFLITPWGVMAGKNRTELPLAVVCTDDDRDFPGFLVGETDSHTYIGETLDPRLPDDPNFEGRIASIPSAHVTRVFEGRVEGNCQGVGRQQQPKPPASDIG